MKAVFDLDDTISIHKNRDYTNARPIEETIAKMRELKADGWEITIYTSRGQVSCNGDLQLIEQRNRSVAEDWLRRHDVPYDRLVFGKPIADLYVDDKGISLADFLDGEFGVLHGGGSGKPIYRLGRYVKKTIGTESETAQYKCWLDENNDIFQHPKVFSFVYNDIYMAYINGQRACDVDATFTMDLINRCVYCRDKTRQKFDIMPHLERLNQNRTKNIVADSLLDSVMNYLYDSRERLSVHGSFCHGDMTLSNIIYTGDKLYFIDPRYTVGANSYLLDLAKLRMSLSGYEKIFGISKYDNARHLKELDEFTDLNGISKDVIALEIMFIFRCYRYKSADDKKLLIDFVLSEGNRWTER